MSDETKESVTSTSDRVQAIARGVTAVRAAQEDDGRWQSAADMGPLAVALVALTEAWFGTITPADKKAYATALRRAQREDGGFNLHPYARASTLGATAVCRAALEACGVSNSSPVVRAADARIRALGGYEVVRDRLLSHGEPAAVFCVMVGLLPADALPPLSPDLAALPWSERMLDGRLHAGVPMVLYACAAVRERFVQKRLLPSFLRAPTRLIARTRLAAYVGQFQNDNGSWNGMVFSTAFALLALEGVGMDARDPMIRRGLDWLETRKTRDASRGIEVAPFDGQIWETAFCLLSLSACGVGKTDPAVRAGVSYLERHQCKRPQARVNQPTPGAPRVGGWSFMPNNDMMPDSDDTCVALAALGASNARSKTDPFIERGVAWLRGMQNDGGGWGSYVHGLPDKTPGVAAFLTPSARLDDLRKLPALVLSPPPELGDPATADLVGRVLWGLGECGLTVDDPAVAKAVAFLERDACPNGSWWGVWNPAYVAGTAFALLGLASVKADLRAPFIQKAAAWLVSVQNADGGWGEDYESFQDPGLAGVGPSSAPLSGIVLRALSELIGARAGNPAVHRAASRAAEWLVATQEPDGRWPDGGYLFTIVPPTLYTWGHHRLYYVLFGLGRFHEVTKKRASRSAPKRGRARTKTMVTSAE